VFFIKYLEQIVIKGKNNIIKTNISLPLTIFNKLGYDVEKIKVNIEKIIFNHLKIENSRLIYK
jgi:hypothetical protein